ncbi:MAG TPA: ATP-binding cassette domain-containing protein, partial [Archangium sp.]|nr:ATP-binding cassette domain-containing protein [Archangium sp.]
GAGKTTLLRLLARLEVHERGQISFDGVPIEDIGLADLRRQIAVVWQDAGLLRGSIWDNVTTGLTDVDVASVDEVMAVCQLEELVRSLPRKYQTPIAEWGASVSAGQRQRLSLARALLRQTPILLLDEATANIDVETEARLLGALFARARKRGQTVVFVTHRLAWARHADRICVVDAGQIAATGTHEQLLRESPPYQRLWVAAAGEGEAGGGEADAA